MNNKLICIKLFNSTEIFCKSIPIIVVGRIPKIHGTYVSCQNTEYDIPKFLCEYTKFTMLPAIDFHIAQLSRPQTGEKFKAENIIIDTNIGVIFVMDLAKLYSFMRPSAIML